MQYDQNPFPTTDPDRHFLWEMLVRRDLEAFLSQDWSLVAGDFATDQFFGLHAHFLSNPDSWRLSFPSLEEYRQEWLRQAAETAQVVYAEPLRAALFRATTLRDIEVVGDRAVLHKKFDGTVARADGTEDRLKWQTLYFCVRQAERWQISSFVGYLPHPLG